MAGFVMLRQGGHTFLVGLFLTTTVFVAAAPLLADDEVEILHVVFSARMFAEINRNDARAAIKVWADTLATARNIPLRPETEVLDGVGPLRRALQNGRADLVSLRIDEYFELNRDKALEPYYVGLTGRSSAEEFMLMVHKSSNNSSLADLRNKRLLVLESARTGMASIWLDKILLESGCSEAKEFFMEVRQVPKVSKAVLPVFFQQMDACLVTRISFGTMAELNPQLRKSMRVIRSSPSVVPSLVCFSHDYQSANKEEVIQALDELHQSSKGQQVLMLFKIDRLVRCSDSDFAPAKKILDAYRQLKESPQRQAQSTVRQVAEKNPE
jgi:phosphonate transport system substrate-binding protein